MYVCQVNNTTLTTGCHAHSRNSESNYKLTFRFKYVGDGDR